MDYKDNFQEMIARYNRELMAAWDQRQPAEEPAAAAEETPPPADTRPLRPLYGEEPEPPSPEEPAEPAAEELPPPEEPVPAPEILPVGEVPMEVGYLQVWTTTARSALPVAGAHVTVEGGAGTDREVRYIGVTDSSGRTPTIPLPAAGRQLSLSPEEGDRAPYTLYDIAVYAEGYYRVENVGLPLYGGVMAVQPVRLIPLPEYGDPGDVAVFEDSAPVGLREVAP